MLDAVYMSNKLSDKPMTPFKTPFMIVLAFLPILILLLVLWIAKEAFGLPVTEFHLWFESFQNSPYIIPIVFATFLAGSFLSLPQWALFAAMVAVFGPIQGGLLSWAATLLSASVNFAVGKGLGYSRLKTHIQSDGRIDRFLVKLKENGFLACFIVRFVPTGPFIFVNMLAGGSGIRFLSFISGTALGIIPKILIIVLLGQGVIAQENRWIVMILSILAACLVVGFIWMMRRRFTPKD